MNSADSQSLEMIYLGLPLWGQAVLAYFIVFGLMMGVLKRRHQYNFTSPDEFFGSFIPALFWPFTMLAWLGERIE